MNKFFIPIILIGATLLSCNRETTVTNTAALNSETDSLAYIIGLNIADNLIAMDSTINVGVVCRAISEATTSKAIMSRDEAKTYYLRYLTHVEPERKRGYEEQYLEDLAKTNRDFTRSNSGLTYNIAVIGDESLTPRNTNDLISMRYTLSRINGDQIHSSYQVGDTLVIALSELGKGVQEGLKMIGQGGRIRAWVPSKLGYGEDGDAELNIAPFETLYYDIELIEMERNGARRNSR